MTEQKPMVYTEPFFMRRLGPALALILRDQLDFLGPRLIVGADRATFTPGYAFEGIVGNAYRKRQITKLSSEPSGDTWFKIAMDATDEMWAVGYVLGADNIVNVTTPEAEFSWVHDTRGLAENVIRPLFIDWVLRRGLIREFGDDYAEQLAFEVAYRRHCRDLSLLYSKFGIQSR